MSCSTTRCYCSTLYGCWSRGRMTSDVAPRERVLRAMFAVELLVPDSCGGGERQCLSRGFWTVRAFCRDRGGHLSATLPV